MSSGMYNEDETLAYLTHKQTSNMHKHDNRNMSLKCRGKKTWRGKQLGVPLEKDDEC